MEEKEISNQESLEIITKMIGRAKRNVSRGGSFYFLLWGTTVAVANLAHWYLEKFTEYPSPYAVWIITIPATILTIIHTIRLRNKATVYGPYDRLYGKLWFGGFVSIVIILFFMEKVDYQINPLILLVAGICTFMSGHLLRFKPLIAGGIALWVSAAIGFNLNPMDQNLLGAIGIFVGYIIPGIMLKRAEGE